MYNKFKKLCKKRGVTPYQVSKKTGISNVTFTEWKNGTYQPKLDKLIKIANYFKVDINYFIDD